MANRDRPLPADDPRHPLARRAEVGKYQDIDLLVGGFPCQDLSVAGQRRGLSASRSSLFFEFARLAGELRPTWLLIENVPGLFSSNKGEDFVVVLETLAELGYGLAWRILDSQYFGVPQRRRRLFIVGHLGAPCPPEVLFEPEGGEWDSPESGKTGQEVANPLGAGSVGRSRRNDLELETYVPELSHALSARDWKSAGPERDGAEVIAVRTYVIEDVSGKQSGDARVGLGVSENTGYTLQRGHQHGVAYCTRAVSENQRGEVVLTDYAHQLTRGGGKPGQGYSAVLVGETVDPDGVREASGIPRRLDSPRYAALGDAVTVPVIEWIVRRIAASRLRKR